MNAGLNRGLAVLALLTGCGPRALLPPPAPSKPMATAFGDDAKPLPRYRSKRLGLSLPLPDGAAWSIDDHSRPELVATHAATSSKVVVAVIRTDQIVGRAQCEDLARARKLVAADGLRTLEDEIGVTQETFDTDIRIALETETSPERPLVGHVMAFGGFLRKCYVFDFVTQVGDASQEPVLSARLAFARARILGGLELDSFGAVVRDAAAPGP